MENAVRLSKDEKTLEFKRMDNLPSTPKKFRGCWELESLYRFVFENDLRKESFMIINEIYKTRKAAKKSKKKKTK